MSIQLIVGLQNPGSDYALTRHNVGAWFVESLAKLHHTSFRTDKKCHAQMALCGQGASACKLLLPLSFMNHSGQSVRACCDYYQLSPRDILVVHDDLDLAVGRIKLKMGGGHGGHNGLRDIMSHLGTDAFHRLRIGIGHPGDKTKVVDHVLNQPSLAEKKQILAAIDRGLGVMKTVMEGDVSLAMNVLNQEGTHGI